jgi:hypothetical protein
MVLSIGKETARLKRMTVANLRQRYAEVFGENTTSRHKQYLIRRILWRLQANAEGGLSERARQRAKELTADSDVRLTAPKTMPAVPGGVVRENAVPCRDGLVVRRQSWWWHSGRRRGRSCGLRGQL